MKTRHLFRGAVILLLLSFMTIAGFADNINTDTSENDVDGEYTFSTEGEKYGYESFLNSDPANYIGARYYDVTIPDEGRLISEVNSSQITHMTIEVYSFAEKERVCEWEIVMDEGVKATKESVALPKGTYRVEFIYTWMPNSIIPYDEPGDKYFTHYISWKKDAYVRTDSVSITPSAVQMEQGKGIFMKATVSPSDAYYKNVSWSSSAPDIAEVDSTGYVYAKKAGEAVITALANDGHTSATCKVTVTAKTQVDPDNDSTQTSITDPTGEDTQTEIKVANSMSVAAKSVKIKAAALKKKAQVIKRAKAISVKNAKGGVSYKLVGVNKSKYKKFFKVNSKNGNITIKKKLKKGTYKVKIKVTAAGNSNYKKMSKNVTVKVIVK